MVRAGLGGEYEKAYLETIVHHTKDEDEDVENGKSKDEAAGH